MSYDIFKVKKSGLLTTVQDIGRNGYQQYGMVVSGAMDPFALQVANLLVGNERGEAALEITVLGPQLEILSDTVLALCGADLSATLDGESVDLWKSFKAAKGQVLRFGAPNQGARTYLSVAGGIDVPLVMGSKSTYTKTGIGGYKGRSLEKGDILKKGASKASIKKLSGCGLLSKYIPEYGSTYKAKVILGPEKNAFSKEGMYTFLHSTYTITQQSDRMGYRLSGKPIEHTAGADIISDAIAPGTVQVPANGEPIILLADRQTTGGYTRIATVITTDLPYIGQMLPGHKLSFEEVTIEEAQCLYIAQEKFLKGLKSEAGDF